MSSAIRTLVGLTKKDGERKQKPGKISRWKGHSIQVNTDESVPNFSADTTSTVAVRASDCLPSSNLENQVAEGLSTIDVSATRKKKSYWAQAAERLYNDDPNAYGALAQLMESSNPSTEPLPYELSKIILKHRRRMEDRQWSLPFKVRGSEVKIRTQLDSIWKVLQVFIQAGTNLTAADPLHVGLPWVGMSLILQGALNDSAQNMAALEGLAVIAPIIARYSEVETIYLNESGTVLKRDFEKCLIDLYTSILSYQVFAACHCKRSTFIRFIRALPKIDDWAAMLRNIHAKDVVCKDFTQIFDAREQRSRDVNLQTIFIEQTEKMEAALELLRMMFKDRERERNIGTLRWISEYIPGRHHHNILVESKMGTVYAGAGQWLFEHPRYVKWATSEDVNTSSFWLCGSVGTGKTSIVSRVIESSLQSLESEEDGQVAYFYCSERKGQSQDPGTEPMVILSSIIRQLSWSPDGSSLAGPVQYVYDKWRGDRPEKADFSMDECSNLLEELVAQRTRTTIIIDAIDECAEPYAILRCLYGITQKATDLVKLFVSSRSCIDVSLGLIDCHRVNIEGQDTSPDMYSYIMNEVKESKRLLNGKVPELEDQLIETLNNHAQGMFRWVQLQLAIFLSENPPLRLPEDVEEKLDRIKNEVGLPVLNIVYNDVYDMNTKNSPRGREYAVRAYRILLCALRSFTVEMLAEAVSLDPSGKRNLHVDGKYVMAICSNFIVADDEDIVRFAHLSVPEYLRSQAFTNLYSDVNAHEQTGELCLIHILNWIPTTHDDAMADLRQSQFSCYAVFFGLTHCEFATQEKRQEGRLSMLLSDFFGLTSTSLVFDVWAKLICRKPNRYSTFNFDPSQGIERRMANVFPGPSIITVSCAWGLTEIVEKVLLAKGPAHETSKRTIQAGLHVASRLGHVEVAKILLENGADVNYRDRPPYYPALFDAVMANQPPILEILLSHDADIEARNRDGLTPLQAATMSPYHDGAVQTLINYGANVFVESSFGFGLTVLHLAAQSHNVFSVRLFLKMGVDPNKVDAVGNTALSQALTSDLVDVDGGTVEIARSLIENMSAAAVVSQNCVGRSALLQAIYDGHKDIIRVFIETVDLEDLRQMRDKEAKEFVTVLQALREASPDALENKISTLRDIAWANGPAGVVRYLHSTHMEDTERRNMWERRVVTSRFTEDL